MTPNKKNELTLSVLGRLKKQGAPRSSAISPIEFDDEVDNQLSDEDIELGLFEDVDMRDNKKLKKKPISKY